MIQVLGTRLTREFSEKTQDSYRASITFDPRFQVKVKRYRRWQDAQAHLVGRLLLLEGLRTFGVHQEAIPVLRYSALERPYFEGEIGIEFSIAHSGEYVLCALSDRGRVGMDTEKVRPIALEDMQLSFSEKEWAAITTSEHPTERLFHYWTQKEAVMKADGRGMLIAERISIEGNQASVEGSTWHLKNLATDKDKGYCAHLASAVPVHKEVSIRWIDF